MTGTVVTHTPAVARLRDIALACGRAAALRAAVELSIAEALGDTPTNLIDLATLVGAPPETLARLLRALICHGVFAQDDDGCYVHTDASRLLREDEPGSIKYIVLWSTEPWTWELWPHLADAIRTRDTMFTTLHGKDFFPYLHSAAPESAAVMDRAMMQSSTMSVEAIVDSLDLSGARSVADVAGGRGHVLAALLERHPGLNGTLVDLPNALRNVDERLRAGGKLASRVTVVPADARDDIPPGMDVYLLKSILDWDDESTVKTLRNVVRAAGPGGRVYLVENLIDENLQPEFSTTMDLLLLLNVGGGKHTLDGLTELIRRAGLRVDAARPVDTYLHLVECTVPAAAAE